MRTLPFFLLVLIASFFGCTQKTEIPLPEHPRPDFKRAEWQNLNGYWLFAADSSNVGEKENWQIKPGVFTRKILVPFSWACPMSEIAEPKVNIGWYCREIKIENPEIWPGKSTCLVFCASDFNTKVWVNGTFIGEHSGGYVPFDFDISQVLKKGANKIVVRVEDEELENRPSGKQYYGNAKGIWQTVYLEARPENYISSIRFTPDIDKKEVKIEVNLAKENPSALKFQLKGDGNNFQFQAEIPGNSKTSEFIAPVSDMKLWSLENPFLYEVLATVSGEGFQDEVSTYFGMRKISAVAIPGKDFQYVALNNKPLYMKLTLDQSYHPQGFYTFHSDQFMKEEIERAKVLGLNGLRIHIKAEIPRKLYWADKLGLLIMEDIPNFWGQPDSIAKANWEYIAEREIARDYNHPSIFSWVLFNETWGLFSEDSTGKRKYTPKTQEWVISQYHKTKAYDPSRLVEDNSACNHDHVITDINTWHDYSPARHWPGVFNEIDEKTFPGSAYNYVPGYTQGNQPMFNSECGAVWGYNGSTGDIDLTWEYHIMMNEFRKHPKIAGFLFTEFHDVINEWNGYYRFDRTKKEFGLDELCPGMAMADFHKDIYVVAGDDFYKEYSGGAKIEMPVGISAVSSDIPAQLKIKYAVYGWDETGEYFSHTEGETAATAEAFSFVPLTPVSFDAPQKNALMIFSTVLEDGQGNILQRNFVPFRVKSNNPAGEITVTKSPSEFSNASWSIKHLAPQDGKKVWGMGSGYFEYEFTLPEGLNPEEVGAIEFRAELAARYPQAKYLEEGEAERIDMIIVSEKGTNPGYGQNSYPQADEIKFASMVTVTANGQKIGETELPDDPADHRGILSWMNQKPGWQWGNYDKEKPWLLDEAGSYGYLVKMNLDEISKKSALETGKVTIQLHVDETTTNRGGLSIYGKDSGRYPMDLTLIIRKK